MASKQELSPILRQDMGKPLDKQEGASYGKRLTTLVELHPSLKKIARYSPFLLIPAAIALNAAVSADKPSIDYSTPTGPHPVEVPTPDNILAQMKQFEDEIDNIDQQQQAALSRATPTAAEIQTGGGGGENEILEIQEVDVGATLGFLEELDRQSEDASARRTAWQESSYPSETIKQLSNQLDTDKARLEAAIDTYGSESREVKQLAAEMLRFWNTEPGEGEIVREPTIIVDPATGEGGKWLAEQISEFLRVVPNPGRLVREVHIKPPSSEYPFRACTYSESSKPAKIELFEPPYANSPERWNREQLEWTFFYEFFGRAGSFPHKDYPSRFLTRAEAVNLAYEYTRIWDDHYLGREDRVRGENFEEDEFPTLVRGVFLGEQTPIHDPEFLNRFKGYCNNLFSRILDDEVSIDKIAQELGAR